MLCKKFVPLESACVSESVLHLTALRFVFAKVVDSSNNVMQLGGYGYQSTSTANFFGSKLLFAASIPALALRVAARLLCLCGWRLLAESIVCRVLPA
jgi:hypothetical protein